MRRRGAAAPPRPTTRLPTLLLPLEAVGRLPVEPPEEITLHRVLTHLVAETQRHVGHADIVRELVDGAPGRPGLSVP